jgi:threonine aldolase
LCGLAAVRLDMASVQTNIVVFHLQAETIDATTLVARARERGVLLNAFGARTVRAVTHVDVSRDQVEQAGEILQQLLR